MAGPSVERVQSSYQQGVSAVQRDGSSLTTSLGGSSARAKPGRFGKRVEKVIEGKEWRRWRVNTRFRY